MDRYDLLTLIGLILLAGGLYLVYPPMALIVPGVVLVTVGVIGAWRRGGSV